MEDRLKEIIRQIVLDTDRIEHFSGNNSKVEMYSALLKTHANDLSAYCTETGLLEG